MQRVLETSEVENWTERILFGCCCGCFLFFQEGFSSCKIHGQLVSLILIKRRTNTLSSYMSRYVFVYTYAYIKPGVFCVKQCLVSSMASEAYRVSSWWVSTLAEIHELTVSTERKTQATKILRCFSWQFGHGKGMGNSCKAWNFKNSIPAHTCVHSIVSDLEALTFKQLS